MPSQGALSIPSRPAGVPIPSCFIRRQIVFRSSWSDGTVYLHDAATGEQLAAFAWVNAADMVLSNRKPDEDKDATPYRLFVAAANTNSVFVVNVSGSNEMRLAETLNVAIMADASAGDDAERAGPEPRSAKLSSSVPTPTPSPLPTFPRNAAAWPDSFPPAGIPPLRACWPMGASWC